jgi:hypothetical protein
MSALGVIQSGRTGEVISIWRLREIRNLVGKFDEERRHGRFRRNLEDNIDMERGVGWTILIEEQLQWWYLVRTVNNRAVERIFCRLSYYQHFSLLL